MMKSFLLTIVFIPTALFIACGDSGRIVEEVEEPIVDGAVYSVSFIQQYVVADSFEVKSSKDNSQVLRVQTSGERHSGERYYNTFNDNTFKRRIVPFTNKAIFNTFVKLDIVSDSDFDELHKAGVSLSDIVRFVGMSAADYIRGGCTEMYDWEMAPVIYETVKWSNYQTGYAPVEALLSAIGEGDLVLIDPLFFLYFEQRPTLSKIHNLTLTVTDNTGKTLTATWQQTFRE